MFRIMANGPGPTFKGHHEVFKGVLILLVCFGIVGPAILVNGLLHDGDRALTGSKSQKRRHPICQSDLRLGTWCLTSSLKSARRAIGIGTTVRRRPHSW